MVKTGTVAKFDYGEAGNLAKYGKVCLLASYWKEVVSGRSRSFVGYPATVQLQENSQCPSNTHFHWRQWLASWQRGHKRLPVTEHRTPSGRTPWLCLLYITPYRSFQGKTVLPEYNHLDFIWGLNAARDVYHPIANHIIGQHFASIQRRAWRVWSAWNLKRAFLTLVLT